MRLLVTGASGLLGLSLCLQVSDPTACPEYTCVGAVNTHPLHRARFQVETADLSQPGRAAQLLDRVQPEALIHCAALANLEACEADPQLARRVNAGLPGELAAECAQRGIRLVHISTDAVFDGKLGGYTETDAPNPLSVYARTKLEGEQAVAGANPDALIARVNFYGWSLAGQRSLAEFFYYNLLEGRPVLGFTDVIFCPLQVNDLADILIEMLQARLSGVYHVVSSQCLSKDDFGRRIARRFGVDESLIRSTTVDQGGLRAPRSRKLNLCTDKLASALGHPLPTQDHGLERLYRQHVEGYPQKIKQLGEKDEG